MGRPVSIIMPAFNEGVHLFENIRTTQTVMRTAGFEPEIVAVDDGSSDDTFAEIERAARELGGVVPARNPYNLGKGMALRTGFDHASCDIVVFLDADLDLHPSQIAGLIQELDRGPCDIVVTSKHHPDSHLDYPVFRKVASWVYYMLIRMLFGLPVRDTQTGLKVFRRVVLEHTLHRILVKKFAYDVELLSVAVRLGYRIEEIPVVLKFRRGVKWGRIRIKDILNIVVDTMAVFYRLRLLHYYDVERPAATGRAASVFVMINGCLPAPDVLARITRDVSVTVACIDDQAGKDGGDGDALRMFASRGEAVDWIGRHGNDYDILAFLGEGCIPVGAWVKNALRCFENPDGAAVCGPVLPRPGKSLREKAAARVSSSLVVAGPDARLRSIARFGAVGSGNTANMFFRPVTDPTRLRGEVQTALCGTEFRSPAEGTLLYDPDVAVSHPVPPLWGAYFSHVASTSFDAGRMAFSRAASSGVRWHLLVTVIALVCTLGWLILPQGLYLGVLAVYAAVIAGAAAVAFDAELFLFIVAGDVCEHLIRAACFPAGIVWYFLGGGRRSCAAGHQSDIPRAENA